MHKCEKCGSDTKVMVQMSVCAPSEMMYDFSKKNMSKKDFKVLGVLRETADYLCTNNDCGHISNGYGNYVTNLKKENDRLKEELKKYKKDRNTN